MDIGELIGNILNKDELRFELRADSESLNFVLPHEIFVKCKDAAEDINELILHQFVFLQMLVEQGLAEEIANGFTIPSEEAVRLDPDTRHLLQLPPTWPGSFDVRFKSHTQHSSFSLQLRLKTTTCDEVLHYKLEGPLLRLTENEVYLPSPEQWQALHTVAYHQELFPDERNEYQNLLAVHQLQSAQQSGCDISLQHFDKLKTSAPEHVTLTGQILDTGDMLLTPMFDGIADAADIEKRLGQLDTEGTVQSLRIKDTFLLLNEKKLKAVHEIINNRKIPKNQIKKFFESPTAFINAELVDLDLGFSIRVRGATVFRHAYFGETDASGIGWFEKALSRSDNLFPPKELYGLIEDKETLKEVEERIHDARKTGATIVSIDDKHIDISDSQQVNDVLQKARQKLAELPADSPEPREAQEEGEQGVDEETDTMVLDVAPNDESLEFGSNDFPDVIDEESYNREINFSSYNRTPFPHQEKGVRWILGLSGKSLKLEDKEESTYGGLLADDMGLGKTYMALVAVSEYYKMCQALDVVERPVLVVAPLSLMETWQDEVKMTFKENPFEDVVVLQSDIDLKKFCQKGSSVELRQKTNAKLLEESEGESIPEDAIQYSLKVGKHFGQDRLDQPKRLVLTTYQTLRDYQFSLSRIDWSYVIFDEAQNIKNPNTLAARAAKGLKAKFKLLATGTPVENHLGDFWSLMDTACPGVLGGYQEFRKTYVTPIRQAQQEEFSQIRLQVGKRLRDKVGVLMLRRLKEDNLDNLPAKIIHVGQKGSEGSNQQYNPLVESTMQGEQLNRYNTAIDVVLEAKQQGRKGNPVLAGLHQLREISLHPLLLNRGLLPPPRNAKETKELFDLSGKMQTLTGILDSIRQRDEKAIIFLINKRLQSFLKIALGRTYNINVDIINGDTKAVAKSSRGATETRKGLILRFEAQDGFGVIIMSPVAAGTGLTVVAANNVIHLERHWNPAKEDQATDRVYRIGQKRDVNVYLPILKHPEVNSFDVNLHSLLSSKVTLKDAVVTPDEVTAEEMGKANFRAGKSFTGQEEALRGKDLSYMSWIEFEALCAELYSQHFDATSYLTATNDHGADVVILGEKNVLIQCKHTSSRKKYDSTEPLVQIHGAKPAYEEQLGKKIDILLAATNAVGYSRKVSKASKTYNVELASLTELDGLLERHKVTRKKIQERLNNPKLFEN